MTDSIEEAPLPEPGEISSSSGRFNPLFILLAVGLVAGGVMAGLTILGPRTSSGGVRPVNVPEAGTAVPDSIREGEPAPDFTSVTPAGEEISLADYRGTVVAVNFWATWCGPCLVEMPDLQAASDNYSADEFVVLAVNAGEPAGRVASFMDELELTFTAVMDEEGDIVDQYLVRVFPTTIWVDEEGIIYAEHFGPLSESLIDRYISELL